MQLQKPSTPSNLSASEQWAGAFIPDFSIYAQRRYLPALGKNSNFIKKLIANIETAKDSEERAVSWDRLLKTLARFTDKLVQLSWEQCDEQSGALASYLAREISHAWCDFQENGYNKTNYRLIHKLTKQAVLCLYACDCKALESFSDTLSEIKQYTN